MMRLAEIAVCVLIGIGFAVATVAVKSPGSCGRRSNIGELVFGLGLAAVMYAGYKYNAHMLMVVPPVIVSASCVYMIAIRIRTGM